MFSRDPALLLRHLNQHCQQAMEAAASLCQTRGHAEITVDHLLIKLLEQGDGDLPAILRRYELDIDSIWQPLLATMDKLPRNVRGTPNLSESLLEILAQAWLIISMDGGSDNIRSVHIYQALLASPYRLISQDAWQLFSLTTVQVQRLLPWLDEVSQEAVPDTDKPVDQAAEQPAIQPAGDDKAAASQPEPEALKRFTINLTQKARQGQIDPVFGRETEIRQMIDILSRRRKNNPILVGDPGVGKTALVEGLALKIVAGEVPDILKTTQVLILDLGLLQAGAGVKGEFEQRLKNVIDAVQNSAEPILLFIDEAHTIIGAGNAAGGADAANLLKPALARGELRTIAATTWSEYKQYFERDAALERRFQMIKVDEPDDAAACLMLRGLKQRYAQYHQIHIRDEAIEAAVRLSRKYLTGRHLPDKAVDLLDTAAARVRMSLEVRPQILNRIDAQLTALRTEQAALNIDVQLHHAQADERLPAIAHEIDTLSTELARLEARYSEEQALATEIKQLGEQILALSADPATAETNTQRNALQATLQTRQQQFHTLTQGNPLVFAAVTEQVIADIVADWTGVPVGSLLQDELDKLLDLENEIRTRVVGQDDAINAIGQSLRAAKAGLKTSDGPLGVFLLTGPSGVGKTETGLALADTLFGGPKSLITINLSEYQESHTVSQLKGSPPGYVGYGQGGVLTEAVRQRPYSVVLLEEVEKAHRDVLNIFYQVFDKGMMRDGEGREIDFKNTVIIMTSNLGAEELLNLLQPDAEPDSDEEQTTAVEYTPAALLEHIRPTLLRHFQAALLARMQVIVYCPLEQTGLEEIVRIKLRKVAERIGQQHGTVMQYDDVLVSALAQSCLVVDSGARNIDHLLNQQILPVIANSFLQWQSEHHKAPAGFRLGCDEAGIAVDFMDA